MPTVALKIKEKTNFGADGRTRTDTTFYSPRILSPVRLPFRHTGKYLTATTYNFYAVLI